ncbi:hypothetical protein V6N13_016717 [Hibiscus sabdariffa]
MNLASSRNMSLIWRGIVRNMKDEELLNWMNVCSFRWSLGKGDVILFWYDTWCGDLPLKIQFPRLFRLAVNKMAVVRDLAPANELQNIKWEKIFQRNLLNRELYLVEELKALLHDYRIIQTAEDKLIWIHDIAGKFSVKILSSLLNSVK